MFHPGFEMCGPTPCRIASEHRVAQAVEQFQGRLRGSTAVDVCHELTMARDEGADSGNDCVLPFIVSEMRLVTKVGDEFGATLFCRSRSMTSVRWRDMGRRQNP
jgi:hypothetical protein